MNRFLVEQDFPYDGTSFRVVLRIWNCTNMEPKNIYPSFLKDYQKSGSTSFWLMVPESENMNKQNAEQLAADYESKWASTVEKCEVLKDWSAMQFVESWECIYHK